LSRAGQQRAILASQTGTAHRGWGPKGVAVGNGVSLGTLVWLIIGVVVALSHGYSIANFSSLLSFLLAIFLWPLVLLGINLHVDLGV
jgi:hypothetical protein